MADEKITELDENIAPLLTDITVVVDDPLGSAKSEKMTLQNLANLILADGYIQCTKTLVYAAADDPSFTFTIANFDATTIFSVGMKLKLTNATVKYFFITKVVFDDPGSTITVYGGTDYDLVDDDITLPYYSTQKAPLGFPLDPQKWTVKVIDSGNQSQASPTSNTWYNVGTTNSQITVPIGVWYMSYSVCLWGAVAAASAAGIHTLAATLSTANNTESDEFTTSMVDIGNLDLIRQMATLQKSDLTYPLLTKLVFYLNAKIISDVTYDTLYFYNTFHAMKILAVCAYL